MIGRIAHSPDGSAIIELHDGVELPDSQGRFRPFSKAVLESEVRWTPDGREFKILDEHGVYWTFTIEAKCVVTRGMVEGKERHVDAAAALRKAIDKLQSVSYRAGQSSQNNGLGPDETTVARAKIEVDHCMQQLWDF